MKTHAENLLSISSTLPEVLRRLGLYSRTSQTLWGLADETCGAAGYSGRMSAGMLWRGEFSTLDSSASPLAANAFLLLDILEGRKPSTAHSLRQGELRFLIRKRQLPSSLAEQIQSELSQTPLVPSRLDKVQTR